MQDAHDPSSGDRERMERYLQWRQRTERVERRRWRFRGAAIIVALGVVAVGLLTWLPPGSRDTRTPVALTREQDSPPASTPPPQVDRSGVVIAPGNSVAAVAIDRPACRQRVVDCVGGWLKGE